MKRILIIAAIASGLFWSGCQKDLDTYQGESGIYFDHQEKETQNNLRADTLSFGWGQIDGDSLETKISLRINLIGDVADYDRKFQVLVTETIIPEELKGKMEAAVEGVDYRAFETECMIPAHEVSTNLDITLLRTEALQTESRALTIALQETEELKFLYSREITDKENNRRRIDLQRVIVMNENLAKPDWWYRHEAIFGEYSMKKSITICDVMGIDRTEWISNAYGNRTAYLIFIGQYMQRWLNEQNPPIYEEDGETLMTMGPNSQN